MYRSVCAEVAKYGVRYARIIAESKIGESSSNSTQGRCVHFRTDVLWKGMDLFHRQLGIN